VLARQEASAAGGAPSRGSTWPASRAHAWPTWSAWRQARHIDLGLQRADSVEIEGQPDALMILMRNLVDNAIKYTPNGGTVDVVGAADAGAARITVEDSGPGIPPEERERVFDRFYRVPGSDAAGSGLGLAIIKSIAERHGASLALGESKRLGGLEVTVTFPV
jgi:two-component system OmpR family sensor kinase